MIGRLVRHSPWALIPVANSVAAHGVLPVMSLFLHFAEGKPAESHTVYHQ